MNYVVFVVKSPKAAGNNYSADELPPPYVPTGASGVASISCKVCQTSINLEGKSSQIVVKCSSCNEATVSVTAVMCNFREGYWLQLFLNGMNDKKVANYTLWIRSDLKMF